VGLCRRSQETLANVWRAGGAVRRNGFFAMQNQLVTVGDIARRLGVPTHRVQYVILRDGIKAAGRAGVLRLFDTEAVERIAAALREDKGVR
jgi:hypothetical protein